MLVFANAKINIGLNIISKRSDNFHDIESVFYPVPIYDIIEFNILKNSNNEFKFKNTGIIVNSEPTENLCLKAFLLLKDKFSLPPIEIHLHKNIPIGAGLGGGSSDGATMINALNDYFHLNISYKERLQLADKIGSDCPFFIENTPKFVTGKGDKLLHLNLNLSGYYIVLIYPNIIIETKNAYKNIIPKKPDVKITDVINKSVNLWKTKVLNDFEKSIFPKYPKIESIKNKLYSIGAEYASMSGSGSTVYGIFNKEPVKDNIFNANYSVWNTKL